MDNTVELLDRLAELNAKRDLLNLDLVQAKEHAIPAEVRKEAGRDVDIDPGIIAGKVCRRAYRSDPQGW